MCTQLFSFSNPQAYYEFTDVAQDVLLVALKDVVIGIGDTDDTSMGPLKLECSRLIFHRASECR